jgi:2-oxoisovalerate dehydrogenase E1 component
MKRAVQYCREGKGPSFVHAKVIRPYSHSLSDDEKLYRCEAERTADAERDPLKRFSTVLLGENVVDPDGLQKIKDEVDALVNEATDQALASPQPEPETVKLYVYSPDVDPTAKEFDNEAGAELSGNAGTMVDLINRCLHTEMARDARIIVFGEDVADCSREASKRLSVRLKARVAFSRSPRICSGSLVVRASSIPRSRKPTLWAAPSAWRRAD